MKIDPSAQKHLATVLKDGQFLKVSVVGGGCNGFSYNFEAIDGPIDGLKYYVVDNVVIDKKSMIFLKNSLLVYRQTPFSGLLSVVNPDAKSTCGCGESFSV